MANITLTGCLNPSTGKVDFDLDTPCGVDVTKMFYGCLETTAGANFGKIKVVTTGNADATCDGTYYGCINWTDGKFRVDVPEECCTEYLAGNNCGYCDTGETPKYIQVTITDIVKAESCCQAGWSYMNFEGFPIPNGTYILEQGSSACRWDYWSDDMTLSWDRYTNYCDSFESSVTRTDSKINLYVIKEASDTLSIVLNVQTWKAYHYYGSPTITNCIDVDSLSHNMSLVCPYSSGVASIVGLL